MSLLGGAIGPRTGGVRVRTADFATPEYEAEIVTRTFAVTFLVVLVNAAEIDPAGILNDAGTGAAVEVELSWTMAPPVGAGPLRVTVTRTVEPPVTEAGETDTPVSTAAEGAGSTARVAVFVVVP